MRKIFTLLLVVVFVFSANAQLKKRKAKLFLKNGTELVGYAKISGKKVRYSKEKRKSKETKYSFDELDHFDIRLNDKYVSFYYKTVEGKTKPILMELIITGKVNVYKRAIYYGQNNTPSFGTAGGFGNMGGFGPSKKISYFLEKDNTKPVIKFKQKFKKEAKEYFKNCSKLAKLIGTKDYRRKNLLEIVDYYNEDCE